MEVHIWAPFAPSAPSFDPECLAVLWYVTLSGAPVRVVASNNVYMSRERALPALVDAGTAVSGYAGIVEHLQDKGYILPGADTSDALAESRDIALQAYVHTLATITQWTLFVNRANYEKVTRPLVSDSIPFPMQYNAAMALQRAAARRAEFEGITNKKGARALPVPKDKAISKLHEQVLAGAHERKRAAKDTRQSLQVLALGEQVYSELEAALKGAAGAPVPLTAGTLLLAANIQLQTLPELEERPLSRVIDSKLTLGQLSMQATTIELPRIDHTVGESTYNLTNYLLSWTPYTRWQV